MPLYCLVEDTASLSFELGPLRRINGIIFEFRCAHEQTDLSVEASEQWIVVEMDSGVIAMLLVRIV